MSQTGNDVQGHSRWWEFYAVRYAMGSVIGGVIFFFLCKTHPALKAMLFDAQDGKLDATLLLLFASFGLTYCYLASAPMLVFHAGRFLLDRPDEPGVSIKRLGLILMQPIVSAALFYYTGHHFMSSELWDLGREFFTAVCAIAVLVMWPQYLTVGLTLFNGKRLFSFYQRLAAKRVASTNGVVESYRHLREHGNSFAIVLLEIVLAIVLFAVGNFVPILVEENILPATIMQSSDYAIAYIAVIFLWILPAALVWLVGTYFEREFSGV